VFDNLRHGAVAYGTANPLVIVAGKRGDHDTAVRTMSIDDQWPGQDVVQKFPEFRGRRYRREFHRKRQ
jgi:hypothetical protein